MASVDFDAARSAASPPPITTSARASQQNNNSARSLHRHHNEVASRKEEELEDDELDPAAFLKSVRELSEKREREDNERFRKLEEEIALGRQERLARKRERAKSISPEKQHQQQSTPAAARLQAQSQVHTPSSTVAAVGSPRPSTPSTPTPKIAMDGVPEFKGFGSIKRPSAPSTPNARPSSSTSKSDTPETAPKPSPSSAMPGRSGTVKWQQRPSSRGAGSRPMSVVGSESSAPARAIPVEEPEPEPEPSRDQIAASLGARDPGWFRQTADRGIGNAAYRKSKDEQLGGDNVFAGRRGLPGMSRETSLEPRATSPATESVNSDALSKTGSTRESGAWSSRFSTTTSISEQSKQSTELPKPAASASDSASVTDSDQSGLGRTLTMSSSQARITGGNDRPASPTKGMGGFVQSAMMKRSDSVSKRWSAQPGASLSRQNSTASARNGLGGLQSSYSMPRLDPVGASSREGSDEPASRPTSSSNNNLSSLIGQAAQRDDGGFAKPALPYHSRSKSVASVYSTTAEQDGATSPPSSPSKRWSPTKTSWMESALAKPDSPKLSPAKNTAPSWMENLARAKAQRESADSTPRTGTAVQAEPETGRPRSPTKSTPFGPARIGTPVSAEADSGRPRSPIKTTPFGQSVLKRSDSRDLRSDIGSTRSITPPTKAKPAGLASRPTSILARETLEMAEKLAAPTTREETLDFKNETKPTVTTSPKDTKDKPAPLSFDRSTPTNLTKPKPEIMSKPEARPAVLELSKPSALSTSRPKPDFAPKPDLAAKPVTDFRSTLRSRPAAEAKSAETPEFLSKVGALRKAQTEKYVAPDVLKDNILRGKTGLSLTGGPQKRERRDELKESLLAKKDQWKQEKDAGVIHERKTSGPPITPSKPEALAKRELLGRAGSLKVGEPSPEKEKAATPEALRRQKSISQQPKVDAPQPEVGSEKPSSVAPLKFKKSTATSTVLQERPVTSAEKRVPSPSSQAKPLGSPPLEEKRVVSPPPATETSKMASRFNPGLASILARGPPAATASPAGSRSESPAGFANVRTPSVASPSEPPAEGGQLQDMRKGRAKGPKRRKGGAAAETKSPEPEVAKPLELPFTTKPAAEAARSPSPSPRITASARFPIAGPKSSASIIAASLGTAQKPVEPVASSEKLGTPLRPTSSVPNPALSPKPSVSSLRSDGPTPPSKDSPLVTRRTFPLTPTTQRSPVVSPKPSLSELEFESPGPASQPLPLFAKRTLPTPAQSATETLPITPRKDTVPEFKGFGSAQRARSTIAPEEDKENSNSNLSSVKTATSTWGRLAGPRAMERPSQISLPTKRDEEAAMRSAGLLASSPARSSSRPGSSNGPGSAIGSPSASLGGPPRPAKSSRIVSGQLREASPNKGSASHDKLPETEAERLLIDTFGSWPVSPGPLRIDTQAAVLSASKQVARMKMLRKTIQEVSPEGVVKQLKPQEEYTLYDEEVYVCTHACVTANGSKTAQAFVWAGESASTSNVEAALNTARAIARKEGAAAPAQACSQGHEPADLIEALGGILVTRRGEREGASKQFMLCGRKHLGHIVFDEVDFALGSLYPAFAYLISYPVTLQQTKLYLWKGSACSTEEISAARLAAMDLSETGEIIEVDNGAEFPSFLKIFGPGAMKSSIPKPTALWKQKATAPDKFKIHLFRIQPAEVKAGLFTAMFSRRPSWSRPTSAPPEEPALKLEAKRISPFTQADLDSEGIYLLDAHSELFVLIGPLFASVQPETTRNALLAQALLFASDYGILAASMQDRPVVPRARVVLSGVPDDFKALLRFWDGSKGLWGTGGLMAGSGNKVAGGIKVVDVDEMVRAVCV